MTIKMVGERFGRLMVEQVSSEAGKPRRFLCLCDCGARKEVMGTSLRSGKTRSCGCLARDLRTKHGLTKTPEYIAWRNMVERCRNPNNPNFHRYGGRGISVHPEWVDSFEDFLAYVGRRPSKHHEIDREDNNGNYEPGNVRWIVHIVNSNNRQNARMLTLDGVTKTMSEWARDLGIPRQRFENRKRAGWSDRDILLTPKMR